LTAADENDATSGLAQSLASFVETAFADSAINCASLVRTTTTRILRLAHIIQPNHLTLTPGARLGVYDITALIGEGGMGQVFRATDSKLKRQVAIKILPPSLAADHDWLARFQREAEVLASLNHSHIAGSRKRSKPHTNKGSSTASWTIVAPTRAANPNPGAERGDLAEARAKRERRLAGCSGRFPQLAHPCGVSLECLSRTHHPTAACR
jgi:hypothetical protein